MNQKSDGMKRLLEFTGNKRGLLTLARVLSGISAIFILGPYLCVYFVARDLVSIFAGNALDTQSLIKWGLLALVLELVGLALYFAALLCSHVVAFHTEKNLKMAALSHLAQMPMGYFDANPSGKLRKIIDDNSFQTETFIAHQLPDLVGAQTTMIASVVLMLIFDWRIGVPLLLLFVIGFILQGSLNGKDGQKFMRQYQDSLEMMNHEAVEYIRGISVVKVFGQTVQSFTKFNSAIKSYRDYALAYTMSCRKGMTAFNSIINSSFLVLVPAALIIGLVSSDLIGFMQSYLFYLIFSPACAVMLNKIMYMTSYKMQAEESMRRIDTILTVETQVETTTPKTTENNDVTFENVTFAYENTNHPAVSHLRFTAKAGATTALVGHSGSGKSTTASLIPRFYDVQEGVIKIGDVDIRDLSHEDLMKKVAFVFQDPKLFKDTLLENIRAGRPSATREEVLQAAHLAQCDDILEKFPQGIDTVYGSKGVYLSGGETQRIAIARAILKDAPIVVLDEATAYADPENEFQIQQAFEGLVKDKTVIMIAHRLSTIQDAEQILVMKQGEVVESGSHDILVKQNGEYARMWDNYSKSTQWHIGNEVKTC
ncbi:MAG: ABC transporter ATP-binding protein [Lachnospiraceae bacterium]